MRSMLGVALCVVSTAAQADCAVRIAETQARIAALLPHSLSSAEHAELNALLSDLCETRQPGDSVVEEPGRTVRTTHGLNPRESRTQDQQTPIIAVEVEGRRRHRDGDGRRAP